MKALGNSMFFVALIFSAYLVAQSVPKLAQLRAIHPSSMFESAAQRLAQASGK